MSEKFITINKTEFNKIISGFLIDIIKTNKPHEWIPEKEAFINQYTGKISYDYSGEVKLFTKESYKNFLKGLGDKYCGSVFYEFLSCIHINSWYATYISNYGKQWISYKDLLEDKYNEWKYENFEIYSEDGEELNEELELELDNMFESFLNDTDCDFYAKLIEKTID